MCLLEVFPESSHSLWSESHALPPSSLCSHTAFSAQLRHTGTFPLQDVCLPVAPIACNHLGTGVPMISAHIPPQSPLHTYLKQPQLITLCPLTLSFFIMLTHPHGMRSSSVFLCPSPPPGGKLRNSRSLSVHRYIAGSRHSKILAEWMTHNAELGAPASHISFYSHWDTNNY